MKIFCPSAKQEMKNTEKIAIWVNVYLPLVRSPTEISGTLMSALQTPSPHSCLTTGVNKSCSVLSRNPLLSERRLCTVWDCWDKGLIMFCSEVGHGFVHFGRDLVNFVLSFSGGEAQGQVSDNDHNDPFSIPRVLEFLSLTFPSLHPLATSTPLDIIFKHSREVFGLL